MKRVVIKFRGGIDPDHMNIPGDCFDIQGDFIYVGCEGKIVAMIRTDIVNYICISEKKE